MHGVKRNSVETVLEGLNFSALIFDCDGTLVDTDATHLMAFCKALAQRNLLLEEKWYLERVGISATALLKAYESEVARAPIDIPAVIAEHDRIYVQNLSLIHEVHWVVSIAKTWKAKVPLSVASGGSRQNVRATLESVGLWELFDHVVTADEVERGKPAPDLFLLAAQKMNVLPSKCVVFENSDEGLEGARRAGMGGIDIRVMKSP
jgi:beta-phosphoglucomutase-like phosphatase (HAD superfamily)